MRPVAAPADTPLLYVLTNELGCRAAFRLRARAMRLLLGAGRRRRDPLLRHAGRERCRANPSRRSKGLPALYAQQKGLAASAGAASGAAGIHRRAGAAVRLLLQRHDHQGAPSCWRRIPSPSEARDSRRDERPSLPLRHVSAHHEGDPAAPRSDGGRDRDERRHAICTRSRAAICSRAAARSSSASASARRASRPAVGRARRYRRSARP